MLNQREDQSCQSLEFPKFYFRNLLSIGQHAINFQNQDISIRFCLEAFLIVILRGLGYWGL